MLSFDFLFLRFRRIRTTNTTAPAMTAALPPTTAGTTLTIKSPEAASASPDG